VVANQGGHIEKSPGDQMMAVFAFPLAQEDDPVRAIKTASEIREVVRRTSPKVQGTIRFPELDLI
jgi:class 3 adenylate cyclase